MPAVTLPRDSHGLRRWIPAVAPAVSVLSLRCCCSAAEGDCLAAKLRPGNVHSVRADAAFAKPQLYAALEARSVKYAIRLPANENLERQVAKLLTRVKATKPSVLRSLAVAVLVASVSLLTVAATNAQQGGYTPPSVLPGGLGSSSGKVLEIPTSRKR